MNVEPEQTELKVEEKTLKIKVIKSVPVEKTFTKGREFKITGPGIPFKYFH